MTHVLISDCVSLIHLLRYLMLAYKRPVLEATWEFRHLWDAIPSYQDGKPVEIPIFPEFQSDDFEKPSCRQPYKVPFRVSGIRLVERVALLPDFEEAELVRVADNPQGFDLWIFSDPLEVRTDDDKLAADIKAYFDRCSQAEPGCFI